MAYPDNDRLRFALLPVAACGLLLGLALAASGHPGIASGAWTLATMPVLIALLADIVRSLRDGEHGLDIVAALSMSAALAFGETLAACIVALMYTGGNFLENYAEGRARRDMHALLSRVPRMATRYRDGQLEDVAIDQVRPGDRLLIRQGELVPVDGLVIARGGILNMAALTGEALPVAVAPGEEALSGASNAGDAFDLVATRPASASTYAGIVRLVEQAQRSKAPMARLADRWSLGFLAVTIAIAGAAWSLSGDPIRAVAVLVVATPCPLILAVPVALVAGLSRAARFGVLIKGARPLEAMARIRAIVLDKTGTLTDGRPQISAIHCLGGHGEDEILRLAASLDQASKHPIAEALVLAARQRGLGLVLPDQAEEAPGEGMLGLVGGRRVVVGGRDFVLRCAQGAPADFGECQAGALVVAVAIDGSVAGHLVMADRLREGAAAMIAALRREGVKRILLATGDRRAVAERIATGLNLDGVCADLTPDQKVLVVLAERKHGAVMMVGDGVNDAPALAAADIGVAMGARGAAASAEAADVVLLVDRLDRLRSGLAIARGARAIALESVIAGIGLSVAAMGVAAAGYLAPVEGAVLQEVIDVAVILNALRALRINPQAM